MVVGKPRSEKLDAMTSACPHISISISTNNKCGWRLLNLLENIHWDCHVNILNGKNGCDHPPYQHIELWFCAYNNYFDEHTHKTNDRIERSWFQSYFDLVLIDALCHGLPIESYVPIAYVTHHGLKFLTNDVKIYIGGMKIMGAKFLQKILCEIWLPIFVKKTSPIHMKRPKCGP